MINWSSFRIIAPPFDERSSGISDVLAVTELTATTYFIFFTQLQVPYPNSIKTCEFVLSAPHDPLIVLLRTSAFLSPSVVKLIDFEDGE